MSGNPAVIVVENYLEMMEIYRDSLGYLKSYGYGLHCVSNPDAALEIARTTDVRVLVTDHNPSMDGGALFLRVKAVQPKVCGVLVTLCPPVNLERYGFNKVLMKDFQELPRLQTTIIRFLFPDVKVTTSAQVRRDLALEQAERKLLRK